MLKRIVHRYVLASLLLLGGAGSVQAADNIYTDFQIKHVFGAQELMISDGVREFGIETSETCSFTTADVDAALFLPDSYQNTSHRDQSIFALYDPIEYNNQRCTIQDYILPSLVFYPFHVNDVSTDSTAQSQTLTGRTPDGAHYRFTINTSPATGKLVTADDILFISGEDYDPLDNDETVYFFYPKLTLSETASYYYNVFPIQDAKEIGRPSTQQHQRRIGFYSGHGSPKQRFVPKDEYLEIVNRTREAVKTRKWKIVNSLGQIEHLPTYTLNTNQHLKIKVGVGTDHVVDALHRTTYLDHRKTFINPRVDWVKVVDKHNKTLVTYYR